MRCALVIPTRNAGAHLDRLLPALAAQRRQPDSILVVDSRSSDDTVERFRAFGARVEVIEPASFNSDSFSAYRSDALAAVGGFPEDVIGSEDAYVAARLLQAGYAVRYAASAEVYHSHDYRLLEEFRRYFDIGVFYGRERWIRAAFGGAGGEGKRYVLAEIQALRAAGALYRVPEIALRSAFKLLGYRLGQLERHLPVALKRRISMFPGYWK
ncbi:glycosyltransferase [Pseudomonas aeruginosa]|uniref:glycosyltransferase family 2 protein n=1 Tax=Pseudomonas aeruginosa TaxID=287 RepID=UPI000F62213B|nr:glycosyltransferase [Pseudomonas aeruginosa]RRI42711.1 glycosyltransferase [Pseudomonas aeruginosa]